MENKDLNRLKLLLVKKRRKQENGLPNNLAKVKPLYLSGMPAANRPDIEGLIKNISIITG